MRILVKMKNLLLLFLYFLLCTFAKAQVPMEPPPNVEISFGLYGENGKVLSPGSKQASVTFFYDDFADKKESSVLYTQEQVKFSDEKYILEAWREKEIVITVSSKGKKMIIHAWESIDSITFTEGEYKIDLANSFLFQQKKYNLVRVIQPYMENFKINSSYKTPFC